MALLWKYIVVYHKPHCVTVIPSNTACMFCNITINYFQSRAKIYTSLCLAAGKRYCFGKIWQALSLRCIVVWLTQWCKHNAQMLVINVQWEMTNFHKYYWMPKLTREKYTVKKYCRGKYCCSSLNHWNIPGDTSSIRRRQKVLGLQAYCTRSAGSFDAKQKDYNRSRFYGGWKTSLITLGSNPLCNAWWWN